MKMLPLFLWAWGAICARSEYTHICGYVRHVHRRRTLCRRARGWPARLLMIVGSNPGHHFRLMAFEVSSEDEADETCDCRWSS